MYAIIKTGGKQYRVEPGDVIDIESVKAEPTDIVSFAEVLAIGDDNGLQVGAPHIEGATVSGQLVDNFRGEKLVVFKMRRRQGSRRKAGHRQNLSRVKILEIQRDGAAADNAAADAE